MKELLTFFAKIFFVTSPIFITQGCANSSVEKGDVHTDSNPASSVEFDKRNFLGLTSRMTNGCHQNIISNSHSFKTIDATVEYFDINSGQRISDERVIVYARTTKSIGPAICQGDTPYRIAIDFARSSFRAGELDAKPVIKLHYRFSPPSTCYNASPFYVLENKGAKEALVMIETSTTQSGILGYHRETIPPNQEKFLICARKNSFVYKLRAVSAVYR